MDSGFVPEGDTFESEFDAQGPLEPRQILWVMDQLLCLEVAWMHGESLAQTVFTSLHVDRILDLEKTTMSAPTSGSCPNDVLVRLVLRAYCMALIKCVNGVLDIVLRQNFYEEEDFATHLYGRELLNFVSPEQAIDDLAQALGHVQGEQGRFMMHRTIENIHE